MAYYLFIRTEDPLSKWELIEVLKSRGVAARALKAYEQMMGSRKMIGKEVVMVEANSPGEAKASLEQQDAQKN